MTEQAPPASTATVPRAGGRLSLVEMFANNTIAANLLMLGLLIGGFLAIPGVRSELFPTVDTRLIYVTVDYPGATPSEIDESVTSRIDQVVSTLDSVERVVAIAQENAGTVSVEIKAQADPQEARDDIQAAVDRIAGFPPAGAEQPKILIAEPMEDVITLVISSNGSESDLRKAARRLEDALVALPSIGSVFMDGARDLEISIEVSERDLRKYSLTMSQVVHAIRNSSLNLSSGELKTGAGDLLLRVNRKRLEGAQFEDVVLRTLDDGGTLTLGEVAEIRDGFQDIDFINLVDGKPSIFLRTVRSEGEDTVSIAKDIHEFMATYVPDEGTEVGVWEDHSSLLRDRINLLVRNGALGFALVLLFLLLMLDLKLAVWVAMGVPISFLGAFLFFEPLGVTISMVSMFALIVVLGIVVDDAIVVGENIGTAQESGLRDVEAALEGVRGVFGPVTVGVVTTMAAFAPLLFMTGLFGELMRVIPIVVILVLLMSLIEVYFILPAHLSHSGKWSRWPLDKIQARVAHLTWMARDRLLLPVCQAALDNKISVVALALVFLSVPVLLLQSGIVRFEFFPSIEADTISAEVEFPVGTSFEATREGADRMLQSVYTLNERLGGQEFKSVSLQVGGVYREGQGPDESTSLALASHTASVQVRLNSPPLRTTPAEELARLWRTETGALPGVKNLEFKASFFHDANRLEFELMHPDPDINAQAAEFLGSALEQVDWLPSVQTSVSDGKRQYDIELTDEGRASGLTEADVAGQLRQAYFGEEVHRIQRGRDELKVMVRYPREDREQGSDLANTRIRLASGSEAPLLTVATLTESRSPYSIERINGIRVHTVFAEVDTTRYTTSEADAFLDKTIVPQVLERFPELTVRKGGFSLDRDQDLAEIGAAMLVALMLIFILIASYLKSIAKTLVILLGIPFGAAGAIIGHWLLGITFSFPSLFGIVALAGVLVNDSLVLVNRFDRLRAELPNLSVASATLSAVRRRFRAVVLTTATTVLGLTPMLFETNPQAQFLVPMAVSMATGIVFSSLVILVLVPVMLDTAQRGADRWFRFSRKGADSENMLSPASP